MVNGNGHAPSSLRKTHLYKSCKCAHFAVPCYNLVNQHSNGNPSSNQVIVRFPKSEPQQLSRLSLKTLLKNRPLIDVFSIENGGCQLLSLFTAGFDGATISSSLSSFSVAPAAESLWRLSDRKGAGSICHKREVVAVAPTLS